MTRPKESGNSSYFGQAWLADAYEAANYPSPSSSGGGRSESGVCDRISLLEQTVEKLVLQNTELQQQNTVVQNKLDRVIQLLLEHASGSSSSSGAMSNTEAEARGQQRRSVDSVRVNAQPLRTGGVSRRVSTAVDGRTVTVPAEVRTNGGGMDLPHYDGREKKTTPAIFLKEFEQKARQVGKNLDNKGYMLLAVHVDYDTFSRFQQATRRVDLCSWEVSKTWFLLSVPNPMSDREARDRLRRLRKKSGETLPAFIKRFRVVLECANAGPLAMEYFLDALDEDAVDLVQEWMRGVETPTVDGAISYLLANEVSYNRRREYARGPRNRREKGWR
ncbi:hypothetical protein H4S07_000802 [Coemansia furcata]|uniref:Uncharacterized protein n=1 Tax=Coemansia furcata TaxID=417177 RepID=A0ACC1LQG1_9FUNG|nr:hypothetical protein H4S07_000802 [Coemansia furcata]